MSIDRLEIACDGSTLGNPGPSGWGWYHSEECWAAGGAAHSTNQVMELSAVLDYLESTVQLPPATPVTLFLDSQYAIKCLTVWSVNWRRNGWKNSKGQPVANRGIIESALELLAGRTGTTFTWVKGHAGHHLNDQADAKCTAASAAVAAGLPVPTGPGWTLNSMLEPGSDPAGRPAPVSRPAPASRPTSRPATSPSARVAPVAPGRLEQIADTLF